jgi:hypothetical protein
MLLDILSHCSRVIFQPIGLFGRESLYGLLSGRGIPTRRRPYRCGGVYQCRRRNTGQCNRRTARDACAAFAGFGAFCGRALPAWTPPVARDYRMRFIRHAHMDN